VQEKNLRNAKNIKGIAEKNWGEKRRRSKLAAKKLRCSFVSSKFHYSKRSFNIFKGSKRGFYSIKTPNTLPSTIF